MNREDIIRMAREAGFERLGHTDNDWVCYPEDIERFAALVASAEREQEPVAWGVFEGNLHDMFFTEAEAVEMARLKGTHAEVKPLYAKEKNA